MMFTVNNVVTVHYLFTVQNVYAPEEDPEMKVDHYHRTKEQDEELGIDQMKVD